MQLVPVESLQDIRGIAFPADCKFRQFIVTGPPGCGKTTLINRIRGWPEEGYIDLTFNGWWKAQQLMFRPREVHLGIPFEGLEKAVAVFESEWLDADPMPAVDYDRIILPPEGKFWFSRRWRNLYAFDFLLPKPEEVFEWRVSRQKEKSHHVDRMLDLEQISRQREVYYNLAVFFWKSGMIVYVRDNVNASPMTFSAAPEGEG